MIAGLLDFLALVLIGVSGRRQREQLSHGLFLLRWYRALRIVGWLLLAGAFVMMLASTDAARNLIMLICVSAFFVIVIALAFTLFRNQDRNARRA